MLDDLDVDEVPAWLASPWTKEQAMAVLAASEKLRGAERAADQPSGEGARVVETLLTALEEVVSSHVDKTEALLTSIQNATPDELVAVLEHGLAVLERLSVASNRKARKVMKQL